MRSSSRAILLAITLGACAEPRQTKLQIAGILQQCPPRAGFAVQPLQQEVGSDIDLTGENVDSGVPSAAFEWSESDGRGLLVDPTSANTKFECRSLGTTTITLVVTDDGGCVRSSSAEVRCVAPTLCGNQQLDEGEVCDGLLSPQGSLPRGQQCASDCRSLIDRCALCERSYCRFDPDTQEDLLALCGENADPEMARLCAAVASCARRSRCGFGLRGMVECYCGTADDAACLQGAGSDGPCRSEIEAAIGSRKPARVLSEATNLDRPVRRADLLLQCDRRSCATVCVP